MSRAENPASRRAWLLGGGLALLGMLCLAGGIALLAWRLFSPEEAVILPPNLISTPEFTPTPGILDAGVVVSPPLPSQGAQIAILPVSEWPTDTPTPFVPTAHVATSVVRATLATTIRLPTSTTGPASPFPTLERSTESFPTDEPSPTLIPTHWPTDTPLPIPSLSPTPFPSASPKEPERIIIENIGLDAPIVPVGQHPIQIGGQIYSQWDVPNERAVGWHQLSAPLGERGNTVLNGHHNVYGEVFRHLVRLEPGNLITLISGTQRYTYVVVQTMTLAESGQPAATRQINAQWILPTNDERVTLITCWPYTANSHRLIVIAVSITTLDHLSGIP